MARVLVFGASGYIGTHLVPRLAEGGHGVRAAARHPAALERRDWKGVERVWGDSLERESLAPALEGIETAYYLVHSMEAGRRFDELDREGAANFRDAAAAAGVKRIVYLGGLQPEADASRHLASRRETGDILREGPVPVIELRAGIVVGPGSAAFEMIRDLVYHLPVMLTPRWIRARSRPIALRNALEYLVRLPEIAEAAGGIYDIGGPEILSYEDMMRQFGAIVGRNPVILPVPAITPGLSSLGIDFFTAVPGNTARALLDGLEQDLVADDEAARALLPLQLLTYRQAVAEALEMERRTAQPVGWAPGSRRHRVRPDHAYYPKQEGASAVCKASPEAVWAVVSRLPRDGDFYFLNPLWKLRGLIDSAVGGPGNRPCQDLDARGLSAGDIFEYWRVVSVEPPRRLILLAEMKLPGSGLLEFEIDPEPDGRTRIAVTAMFHPAGAPGLLYWAAFKPVHGLLFNGMVGEIARRAEAAGAPAPAAA